MPWERDVPGRHEGSVWEVSPTLSRRLAGLGDLFREDLKAKSCSRVGRGRRRGIRWRGETAKRWALAKVGCVQLGEATGRSGWTCRGARWHASKAVAPKVAACWPSGQTAGPSACESTHAARIIEGQLGPLHLTSERGDTHLDGSQLLLVFVVAVTLDVALLVALDPPRLTRPRGAFAPSALRATLSCAVPRLLARPSVAPCVGA